MKPIKHKHSARLRNPTTSIGSTQKIKALQGVSKQQVSGLDPNLWLDWKAGATTPGAVLSSFPTRKGVSPTASGGLRPVMGERGVVFAGAQSLSKASGIDTAGYEKITLIVVGEASANSAFAALVETYNPYWYAGNAIVMGLGPSSEWTYGIGGSTDGSVGITGPEALNEIVCQVCSYDRTLSMPDATTNATNGVVGTQTSIAPASFTGTYNSNAFYLGSRGSSFLFYEGAIRLVAVIPGAFSQEEVLGLSRVGLWASSYGDNKPIPAASGGGGVTEYALDSVAGTTLTDPAVILQPGAPGYYPANYNDFVTFEAPVGQRVRATITEAHLDGWWARGINFAEPGVGFLRNTIYGDSSTPSGTFVAEPVPLVQESPVGINQMEVHFTSDTFVRADGSFRIEVEFF